MKFVLHTISADHVVEFSESYRPNNILVDGEPASMDLMAEKHGYNWQTSAHGNILYYATESGKIFAIEQGKFKRVASKVREAEK